MLPGSLAIGWTLWRRHRWGHLAVLGYLLVAGMVSAVLPAYVAPAAAPAIFGPMMLPLVGLAMYLLMVFSYGAEAPMGGRESCFPADLFRLPVSTGALAGWPMAYGAAAAGLLWLATAWFILRPWLDLLNAGVPLWWPAMLAVTMLAWVQALLWSGFGLPGLRVILAIAVIPGLIGLVEHSVNSGASEGFLVSLLAGLAGVAWVSGYVGVRHARRGDVPDWGAIFRPLRRLAVRPPRRRQPFASAGQAQVRFEWRRAGNSLPIMTALVLPFVLLPLLLGSNDVMPTARTLLSALAVPVVLAGLAGTTVSGRNPWVKDYYGVAPFTATLPMTTGGLVAAKLKAAALSTLTAWTIVLVAVPLAVVLTGNLEEVAGWWQGLRELHPVKVVAGILGAAVLLVVVTWKRVVDSLFLGLTGRKWVIQGAIFGGMAVFFVLCLLAGWIYHHPETHATCLALLPWLLCLLVLCRLLAAGWALRQSLRLGILDARIVLYWGMAWLLLGSGLFGLLVWIVPAPEVPVYRFAIGIVFVLPIARLAAAPLTLAWNRHR